MTPKEEYLAWLDARIDNAKSRSVWDDRADAVASELEDAKDKFDELFNFDNDADKAGNTR